MYRPSGPLAVAASFWPRGLKPSQVRAEIRTALCTVFAEMTLRFAIRHLSYPYKLAVLDSVRPPEEVVSASVEALLATKDCCLDKLLSAKIKKCVEARATGVCELSIAHLWKFACFAETGFCRLLLLS